MLVSDEHVIERVEVDGREAFGTDEGVVLRFEQTDPSVIRDGVDGVAVVREDDDIYRVDYWGYAFGRLRVTEAGVDELGADLLAEPGDIGYWAVDAASVDPDDLPWWIPEGATVE